MLIYGTFEIAMVRIFLKFSFEIVMVRIYFLNFMMLIYGSFVQSLADENETDACSNIFQLSQFKG